MANSREAQFKRETIEVRTLQGWQLGAAYGYDREVKYFAELELIYYRLTKREKHRQAAEGHFGSTPVREVNSGKPHDSERQRLAEFID